MQADDLELRLGRHAPDGSLRVWWDPAVPLPPALIDALQARFPEAPALVPAGELEAPSAALPVWLAALAPDLVDCFLEYADRCESHDDWAGMRAVVPHFAAAVRSTEELARAGAKEPLTLLAHRLRGGWVRLLYNVGRYAEAWAQSAGVPAALAAHTPAARREAWIIHGLLALEVGEYLIAGETLATAETIGAPGEPRAQADWLLALGQADLAAACEQVQVALADYAALDTPAAPAWVRVRAAVGRVRIYTRLGHMDVAAPLIEAARVIDAAGWSAGPIDMAAAEHALMCGQPSHAAEHAAAAREALNEIFGEDHPATAAAALVEAQASYDCGAYTAAEYLSATALPQLQAAHGSHHPYIVQALALRGLLAGIRRDTSALTRNLAAAVQAAHKIAETSDVAEITADMLEATIALAQGRAGRARGAAMRALEQARSTLDAVHPLTAACLDVVAECERTQGRWSVARVYGGMALALRQSVFGAEHPLTATSWEQLGHIDLDARCYTGARNAFEQVVSIRRAALGAAHPLTAAAQLALAHAAVALGDLAGAEAAAAGALSGFERVYGSLHPATRSARALLGQFSSPLRRGWWRTRARLRRLRLAA
jgi:hypothetical protein